jgi:hypothetical protein
VSAQECLPRGGPVWYGRQPLSFQNRAIVERPTSCPRLFNAP